MTTRPSNRASDAQLPLHTLFRAIANGDAARVSLLLAESPTLAAAPTRTGATRDAAASFYLERIGHYVYQGDSALHVAAAGYHAAIARDLLSQGALVRAKNRRGAEPLHYACDGNPESPRWNPAAQAATIECLLAGGADPNAVNKNGVTPLHRAIRTRCTPAVRVLLEHGANVLQTNDHGSTPMLLAVRTTGRGGSGSPAARAEQQAIVRLLVEHGAHS